MQLIPHDLHAAVMALPFENPSDGRLARHAVAHPERSTRATVQWLAALVARGGARYDDSNPAHAGPHEWPLKGRHAAEAAVGAAPRQDPPATPGSAAAPMPPTPPPLPMAALTPALTAAGALLAQPPPPFSVVSSFMP